MDDAPVMRGSQAEADSLRNFGRLARWNRPFGEPLPQRLALQKLRDGVGRPLVSPEVEDRRMFGCDSAATAFASRSNRASASASAASDCGSTLTATSRSSFVSRARYTSPIPPAPSGERIS